MNRVPDPSTVDPASAAPLAAVPPQRTLEFGPAENEVGGILTIDLAALAANWRLLSRRISPVECAAVVKADAYGCGLEEVAEVLLRIGCSTFFVADLAEARRLRAVSQEATIFVLNGVMPGSAAGFAEIYAQPVINSLTELAEWDAFVATSKWQGGAALQVDTGMNRLGLSVEEALAVAPRLHSGTHGITLLMSHFACADEPEHPLNERQVRVFRELRMQFRGIPASLANSSGIFLGPFAHCDLVRPGGALYGCNPTPGQSNPMQPVIRLEGRIAQVRRVEKGDTIGYGARFTARRPSRIAVLAVGYADGYLRSASGYDGVAGGEVTIAGQRCPIVGRISMDLTAVDVTDLPEGAARRGGLATLIGEGHDLDRVAAAAGTIAYEILTGLRLRYRRVYKL